MATRLYVGGPMQSFQAADVFSRWDQAAGAQTFLIDTVKRSWRKTSTLTSVNTGQSSTSPGRMMFLFVTRPLAAQTLTGTVEGYMHASETVAASNASPALHVRVVQPDGTSGGTPLTVVYSASNEFSLSPQSRRWPNAAAGNTLTSVGIQSGARLVLEVGVRASNASDDGSSCTVRYMDNASAGDIAAGQTDTDTTMSPWFEFSQTLTFLTPPFTTAPRQHNLGGPVSAENESDLQTKGSYTRDSAARIFFPHAPNQEIGSNVADAVAAVGGAVIYVNRVHDVVASRFVRWSTTFPDMTGSQYPGPGIFGVTTSDYVVESSFAV